MRPKHTGKFKKSEAANITNAHLVSKRKVLKHLKLILAEKYINVSETFKGDEKTQEKYFRNPK